MIETSIFFDIETLPTDRLDLIDDIAAGVRPPATMKKPETIAAWEASERPAAVAEAVAKTALDGGTGRIASIAWAVGEGEIVCAHTAVAGAFCGDRERELLAGFFAECDGVAKMFRVPPTMVGHNVVGFDVRWLWKRSVVLGVRPPHWWPVDARPWDHDRVFDTMIAWEGNGGRISQDRLARILGLRGKGDVDGSRVWGLWQAGEFDRIADYNADDVECVRGIWKRITDWQPAVAKAVAA